MGDVRNLSRAERISAKDALHERISERIATRDRDDWASLLDASDIAWSPVHSLGEVATDPHFGERNLFSAVPDTDGSPSRYVAQPLVIDGKRHGPSRGTPALGEGNDALLG
jgi:crotonobetainyl-CoA:carnitine CoA-transferase CaiB-like acyl-CoA transferase